MRFPPMDCRLCEHLVTRTIAHRTVYFCAKTNGEIPAGDLDKNFVCPRSGAYLLEQARKGGVRRRGPMVERRKGRQGGRVCV